MTGERTLISLGGVVVEAGDLVRATVRHRVTSKGEWAHVACEGCVGIVIRELEADGHIAVHVGERECNSLVEYWEPVPDAWRHCTFPKCTEKTP